jgi:hypothetical protein
MGAAVMAPEISRAGQGVAAPARKTGPGGLLAARADFIAIAEGAGDRRFVILTGRAGSATPANLPVDPAPGFGPGRFSGGVA